MAKKTMKSRTLAQEGKPGRSVRLDLTATDHRRLESCARERGLSNASYSRMAVLERIKADEGRDS